MKNNEEMTDVEFILNECPNNIRKDWEDLISLMGEENISVNRGLYDFSVDSNTGPNMLHIVCPFWNSDPFTRKGELSNSSEQKTYEHNKRIIKSIHNRMDKYNEFFRSEELLTVEEISSLQWIIERPYRPIMLLDILKSERSKHLNNRQVWKLINDTWIDQEMNSSGRNVWKQIFSLRKVPPHFIKHLPNEMTVYRGGEPDGFSWTLSRETGEWFSQRFGQDLPLCSMKVKKEDILFFTNDREESEVIVFPTTQQVEYLTLSSTDCV